MMANDTKEEFWGCNLSKDKKQFIWDPTEDSEEDIEHKLQISTVALGAKAKKDERNVIEISTEDDDNKTINCAIASLRVGAHECSSLDLGFHNKTKFILKEGSGPVSICGVHLQALPLDYDEDYSSDDEDVPNLVRADQNDEKSIDKKTPNKQIQLKKETNKKDTQPAKRPAPAKKEESAKKMKFEVKAEESDEDDDEDDDDDEEDEDDEEAEDSLLDNEAVEGSEDSEDEDEPEDGDDLDEDDDEDDEDDDDEEMDSDEEGDSEEEERPIKSQQKKLPNGNAASHKKQNQQQNKKQENKQTPAKQQPKKDDKKTPNKKDTPGKGGPKKTPDELKAMLLKSPNLPKKFDKFTNLLKNNFKVVDNTTQKELWEYIQKNKK